MIKIAIIGGVLYLAYINRARLLSRLCAPAVSMGGAS